MTTILGHGRREAPETEPEGKPTAHLGTNLFLRRNGTAATRAPRSDTDTYKEDTRMLTTLLLDLDGVLLLMRRGPGSLEVTIDGTDRGIAEHYRIHYRPVILAGLAELRSTGLIEIVILSTWLDMPTMLDELTSAMDFEYDRFLAGPYRGGWGVVEQQWKRNRAIEDITAHPGRVYVWVDDELGPDDRAAIKALSSRHVLIAPHERAGLTTTHLRRIRTLAFKHQEPTPVTTTLESRPPGTLETEPQGSPEPHTGTNLFLRRNGMGGRYVPLESMWQAEQALGSTTFDDPWVTILSGRPHREHTYFQILGTPDRLVAEGGAQIGGRRWHWRASARPVDYRMTSAGPPWYSEPAYFSDLLTVDDARHLIWPTLADVHGTFHGTPGFELLHYR